MISDESIVILFFSNNHVFWAQEIFNERGVAHRIVPVPRHLSSDCGYCIRAARNQKQTVIAILSDEGIEIDQVVDD